MRALVTGGTGFIGSNLVKHLLREGWEVVATGREGEQRIPEIGNSLITGDLGEIDWNSLGKFDAVFHQAAITDTLIADEKEMMRVNYEASKRLFEAAAKAGCRRIVYASSTAVYGARAVPYRESDEAVPLNAYGRSKLELDLYAAVFSAKNPEVRVVGLRYCNVYGPGEGHKGKMASMAYQLAQQMVKGNPRLFKWGEQKRDYIYVDDVVEANLLALNARKSIVVNCGSGRARSFNELFGILAKTSGLQRDVEYIDNPYAAVYQNHTECEMSLAKKGIGFSPKTSLEEGIRKYFETRSLFGQT